MSEEVTIYIVQWPLTEGIIEAKAIISIREYADVARNERFRFGMTFSPSHYRLTKAEAVKAAEKARVRKIAAVEKQLAKLRAMTFEDS